jgi:hypothetical protein
MPTSPPDLLREVTRAGFVPPPERHAALCAPPGTIPPDRLLAEETHLRGEVDDFAAAFFATPVGARRQRWQALSDQCAFSPPLTARLTALQPALEVDLRLGDLGNPRTAQLASHVAGLFVLAPAARAAQRQAVLRGMRDDVGGWEENVRQLQALAPAVAALEPTLLASVLGWREQQQRLARAREGRQPAARPAPRSLAHATAPAPKAPAAKGSGGRAVGWGAIVLVGIAIRVCAGIGSHSTPDVPRFNPERFQVPQHQIDPQMFEKINRQQQLNQEEEERRKKESEDWDRLIQDGQAGPWRKDVPWPPPGPNERPHGQGPETRRER